MKRIVLAIALILATHSNISSEALYIPLSGLASWYAEFSPGIRPTTANLEKFDHDKLTCAIWDVPFNTLVEVTNLENGKKVIVRVNDRGPAKRLCGEGRVIDLTMAAFQRIENLTKGLARVRLRILD
jgi:rare lipoprotein A